MPISTLIIRGRKWKEPRCFSTHGWIMKSLCMYAMEFYLGINKLNDKSWLERKNWKILYYKWPNRSQKTNKICSLLFVDVCFKSLDFSTWLGVATGKYDGIAVLVEGRNSRDDVRNRYCDKGKVANRVWGDWLIFVCCYCCFAFLKCRQKLSKKENPNWENVSFILACW